MSALGGRLVAGVATLATLAAAPVPGAGQLLQAIESTGGGVVAFSYATRPGTRFCGRGGHAISVGGNARMERGRPGGANRCREGSAVVEVTIEAGAVTGVRFLGPEERPSPRARDLGQVSAEETAGAFLEVARGDGPATDDAIVAAVVAESVVVWPDLLDIARDRTFSERTRKSALFWLGQEAAVSVTGVLVETADDGSEVQEIRDAAVFALSQRPEKEGMAALMTLAREAEHADTRRSAFFWLAQLDDAKVPEFFAEILAGP